MTMDNKGNITLEIAIALVTILMISAIVINFSENMTSKAITASEKENTEVLISEVIDNLINNPGVPENWQEYKKGTPGLAVINEQEEIIPNSVSYIKFLALQDNYKKLVDEGLFNSKLKTSMELIPHESRISSVKIGNNNEQGDIFSQTRLVKCDFFKKYIIKDFQNEGKCNHNHKQKSHSCNYFKIFKGNLKKADYYLLIDDSEENIKYIVDTTASKNNYWKHPKTNKIYLNDEIDFYDDTSAVVFIHFDRPHAKAAVISVPKNFDRNKLDYDYFRTNDCDLILKAWY